MFLLAVEGSKKKRKVKTAKVSCANIVSDAYNFFFSGGRN